LARFEQFKKTFCDPNNSKGALKGAGCTATKDDRYNADIDVTHSLMSPLTLKLDFATSGVGTKTNDEENLLAMASNLFAHDLPLNLGQSDFNSLAAGDADKADARKMSLMDYRALTAKRTVAQNSFAALAAMKAEGSGGSATYVKQMVEYLGLSKLLRSDGITHS